MLSCCRDPLFEFQPCVSQCDISSSQTSYVLNVMDKKMTFLAGFQG